MWTVRWSDGSTMSAPTATALLDGMRALPWNQVDGPISPQEFKGRMSDRAWRNASYALDPLLCDEEFVLGMEKARLLTVQSASLSARDDSAD